MSLAQLVRTVDMVRQQARQAHLGLHYKTTFGADDDLIVWHLHVDATSCTDPWVVLAGDKRTMGVAIKTHAGTPLIGERQWTDFHDDARLMAWTLQHDALVEKLSTLTGREFTPECLTKDPAQHASELAGPFIRFVVRDAQEQLIARGTLAVDDPDFERLILNAERVIENGLPKKWLGVPLPLVVRTAPLTVAADTLRNCGDGDVIVLGHQARLHKHLEIWHASGERLPVRCSLGDDGIEVSYQATPPTSQPHLSQEHRAMSKADHPEGANGAASEPPHTTPTPTHQIPVQLCVQTGTVDVTLSDLNGMQAGAVLPLEAPLQGTNVSILVNGAVIGDGELVAAGDKLGVCVKRWRPDGL